MTRKDRALLHSCRRALQVPRASNPSDVAALVDELVEFRESARLVIELVSAMLWRGVHADAPADEIPLVETALDEFLERVGRTS